jgi:hypothetical protein
MCIFLKININCSVFLEKLDNVNKEASLTGTKLTIHKTSACYEVN